MNRKFYGLIILLLLAGWPLSGAVSGKLFTPTAARAQESDGTNGGRQWEYCALVKAAYVNSGGGDTWVVHFRSTGVQLVSVQASASEGNGVAMAKAVTQLGAEGWEMVGQGPLEIRQGATSALYFKRPKQ